MKSLRGHFLVAAPHQLDPNFVQAVVLVVEHADFGAIGVIVNCLKDWHKQTSRQRNTKPRRPKGPRRYFGGPVTGPLMAIHADELFSEIEVLPGVFFAGREKNVCALMRSREQPCKIFTGYAGWSPGQLEREIEDGIWRAVPATAPEIFAHGDDLWERLLRRAFVSALAGMCNIKHVPSDASLN
jgi:putative transcriptional regulator